MVMSQSFSSGLMLLGHGLGKHFSPYHLWRDRKVTRVWGLAMILLSRSNKTLKGFFYSICFCCRTDFELMGKWSSPSYPSQSKRKLSTLDWGYDYRKWSFPPTHTLSPQNRKLSTLNWGCNYRKWSPPPHALYLNQRGSFLHLIEAVSVLRNQTQKSARHLP